MVIFTCKDRFDDMMTCIYEAWASHLGHNNIKLRTEPIGTMELFCEYRHVEADKEKTESVIRTIQQKISFRAYQIVYHAAIASFFNIGIPLWKADSRFTTESDRNENI